MLSLSQRLPSRLPATRPLAILSAYTLCTIADVRSSFELVDWTVSLLT